MKKKPPKVICFQCSHKGGNWCKKFQMPIYLALRTSCMWGLCGKFKNQE